MTKLLFQEFLSQIRTKIPILEVSCSTIELIRMVKVNCNFYKKWNNFSFYKYGIKPHTIEGKPS